nr:unnamed protein product [Callosobruchus chinensis]
MDTVYAEMKSWLSEALQNENFEHFEVKLSGEAEKGEGFMGQVIFVTADGITKESKPKKLDLVLKVSKDNETFRESIGKLAFDREIHMYEDVFVAFGALQKQNRVLAPFEAYPKCYKCLKTEKKEILILENLRPLGFELHDRKICFNLDHTRTVLQQYAKFHALSFALKDQNREQFDKLAGCSGDLFLDFLSKPSTKRNTNKSIQSVLTSLKNVETYSCMKNLQKFQKEGQMKL